ncbi:helix-turn-helix domain-containing protein [Bifidobacterium eulemuris]|uniref:DNA-binding protein n=2 Tax=Bifidobacterium eulemuris TaxID=1765219 RepID=A0A261GAJ6_9BIFI|nr:helix-turn-helix transcriptional regulator [Bifidobacterium eulemuris]OZG68205.1 DNA-binding protein [Bifidobacterium eulemuris]QOL31738.1 helix-turn-helix transcriptional regulator [Bifidobacterium eulemuris]
MSKKTWLEAVTHADNANVIAAKTGITRSTAWRQWNDDLNFSAENVIKIARAFGADPVDGLIAFGYLEESERNMSAMTSALRNATNDELINEMARRINDYHSQGDYSSSFDSETIHVEPDMEVDPTTIDGKDFPTYGIAANIDENRDIESETPTEG